MKIGDLVKPAPAYIYDETDFVGIIVEEHYCDGGGGQAPETEYIVQWPPGAAGLSPARTPCWQDFELELVNASR
jgi:hypothetical protein